MLEFLAQKRDQALIHLEGLHGVAGREKGAGEGAQARADFLDGFRSDRSDGFGDPGSERGFGEKVLPKLTEGTEAAGGQDFLDPGGVQSWRRRMAWSSPGLRMPCTSSEPLP